MRVSIGDTHLWFDVDGAGLIPDGAEMQARQTVVVLHGGPGLDHSYLRPDLAALAEDAQLVFVDQRGHGRSDPCTPDLWTLDRWADDVAAFCAALGIERPVLLGHSFGGFVALAAAARHPGLASGVIAVATAAYLHIDAVIANFGSLGGEEAADAAAQFFADPTDHRAFIHFGRVCYPLYSRKGTFGEKMHRVAARPEIRSRFFAPGGEAETFDSRAGLRTCRVPTLMLHGEQDPIIPAAFARETAAAFPKGVAEIAVYNDCAHDVFGDRARDAEAAMRAFLHRIR